MQRRRGSRHSNIDASEAAGYDAHRRAQGHFEVSGGGGKTVTHPSSYTDFYSQSVNTSQQPKEGFVTFRWPFLPPLNM